jgi:hypothetical protein
MVNVGGDGGAVKDAASVSKPWSNGVDWLSGFTIRVNNKKVEGEKSQSEKRGGESVWRVGFIFRFKVY